MKNCHYDFYPEMILDGIEPAQFKLTRNRNTPRQEQLDIQANYKCQCGATTDCSYTLYLLNIEFMENNIQKECWTLFARSHGTPTIIHNSGCKLKS